MVFRWRPTGVLRYVSIVVLGLIVGILAGVVLTLATTKSYVASSTLFLSIPARTAGELNDGNVFAEARVQSYVDVATSPEVLNAVIRSTGVSLSEKDLNSEVTATAPPNKVLLELSVQDPSAERARTLCRALGAQVIATVDSLESDGPQQTPIRLSVVRAAVLPTSPSAPRPALYIGVAGLLGLVIGGVIAVAVGRFTERRDELDVARAET